MEERPDRRAADAHSAEAVQATIRRLNLRSRQEIEYVHPQDGSPSPGLHHAVVWNPVSRLQFAAWSDISADAALADALAKYLAHTEP